MILAGRDGTFTPTAGSALSVLPGGVLVAAAIGDFDRDGTRDISTANIVTPDISVLLNRR